MTTNTNTVINNVTVYKRNGKVASAYINGEQTTSIDHINNAISGLKIAKRTNSCVVYTPDGGMVKVASSPKPQPKQQWEKVTGMTTKDDKTLWYNGKVMATKHKAHSGRYYYKVVATEGFVAI